MSKHITVLLPTYNRPDYLYTSISCIKNQIFENWLLFVINDGGTDVSNIVNSFNDERIYYFNRSHEGKASALNFGLSLVKTKYIAYMDDDDEVFSNHLSVLYEAAEKNKKEFVFSDTYLTILDNNGNLIKKFIENEKDVTFEDIRFFNKINHKQILHTKRLSDKVGLYDTRMQILIDFDYIRRLSALEKPFHVHCITGNHILRKSADGIFTSISGLWKKDRIAAGRSLIALFEKTPEDLVAFYFKFIELNSEIERNKKYKEKYNSRVSIRIRNFLRRIRNKIT